MSTKNEMEVYNSAKVSRLTGEVESYDNEIFPEVVRQRELQIIKHMIRTEKPNFILDYGCGGGWLSLCLQKWGFKFVGLDISKNMVRNAKIVLPDADFIVCDAMLLPFKEDVFDFIIGISILHHLDLNSATNELKRVSLVQSTFLFMEPNLLNPFSAFGRRFFTMETHTKGEKTYTPQYLKNALSLAGFNVEKYWAMFFLAFPAARFIRIIGINPPSSFIKMIYFFECKLEKIPGIKYLNSIIVAIAKKKR